MNHKYGFGPKHFKQFCGPHWKAFIGDIATNFGLQHEIVDFDDEFGVYKIKIMLPGTSKDKIKLKASNYAIKVKVENGKDEQQEFKRKIRFRRKIIPEQVSAKYTDGLLELTAPVVEKEEYKDVTF